MQEIEQRRLEIQRQRRAGYLMVSLELQRTALAAQGRNQNERETAFVQILLDERDSGAGNELNFNAPYDDPRIQYWANFLGLQTGSSDAPNQQMQQLLYLVQNRLARRPQLNLGLTVPVELQEQAQLALASYNQGRAVNLAGEEWQRTLTDCCLTFVKILLTEAALGRLNPDDRATRGAVIHYWRRQFAFLNLSDQEIAAIVQCVDAMHWAMDQVTPPILADNTFPHPRYYGFGGDIADWDQQTQFAQMFVPPLQTCITSINQAQASLQSVHQEIGNNVIVALKPGLLMPMLKGIFSRVRHEDNAFRLNDQYGRPQDYNALSYVEHSKDKLAYALCREFAGQLNMTANEVNTIRLEFMDRDMLNDSFGFGEGPQGSVRQLRHVQAQHVAQTILRPYEQWLNNRVQTSPYFNGHPLPNNEAHKYHRFFHVLYLTILALKRNQDPDLAILNRENGDDRSKMFIWQQVVLHWAHRHNIQLIGTNDEIWHDLATLWNTESHMLPNRQLHPNVLRVLRKYPQLHGSLQQQRGNNNQAINRNNINNGNNNNRNNNSNNINRQQQQQQQRIPVIPINANDNLPASSGGLGFAGGAGGRMPAGGLGAFAGGGGAGGSMPNSGPSNNNGGNNNRQQRGNGNKSDKGLPAWAWALIILSALLVTGGATMALLNRNRM